MHPCWRSRSVFFLQRSREAVWFFPDNIPKVPLYFHGIFLSFKLIFFLFNLKWKYFFCWLAAWGLSNRGKPWPHKHFVVITLYQQEHTSYTITKYYLHMKMVGATLILTIDQRLTNYTAFFNCNLFFLFFCTLADQKRQVDTFEHRCQPWKYILCKCCVGKLANMNSCWHFVSSEKFGGEFLSC